MAIVNRIPEFGGELVRPGGEAYDRNRAAWSNRSGAKTELNTAHSFRNQSLTRKFNQQRDHPSLSDNHLQGIAMPPTMKTRTVRPTVESDRAMADGATAERKAEAQCQADLGHALEDLLVGVWRAERVWRLEDRCS